MTTSNFKETGPKVKVRSETEIMTVAEQRSALIGIAFNGIF